MQGSSSPAETHSFWKIITGAAVSINLPNCSPVCIVISGCFPGNIVGVLGGWRVKSQGHWGGTWLLVSVFTGWSCCQHCTDPSWDLHEAEDKGEIILWAFRKGLAEKNRFRIWPWGWGPDYQNFLKVPQQPVRWPVAPSGPFLCLSSAFLSHMVNVWVFRNISCVRELSVSCDTEPSLSCWRSVSCVVNCFTVHVQSLSVGLGCGVLIPFVEPARNDPWK